jgi:hypothetical protein
MIKGGNNKILLYITQDKEIGIDFALPVRKKFTLPSKKWITVTSSGIKNLTKRLLCFKRLKLFLRA